MRFTAIALGLLLLAGAPALAESGKNSGFGETFANIPHAGFGDSGNEAAAAGPEEAAAIEPAAGEELSGDNDREDSADTALENPGSVPASYD